jgi:multiple sugar transport system permease protein
MRVGISTIALTVLGLVIGLTWFFPVVATIIGSFIPFKYMVLYGWWDIKATTLSNYVDIFDTGAIRYLVNSLVISSAATVLPIIVGIALAFSIRRRHIPYSEYLVVLFFLLQVLPEQSVTIPVLSIYRYVSWIMSTYLGVILVHTAFALPWITFFFYNFLSSVPPDVVESAEIDGASEYRLFYDIVFPIMREALISVAALQFVFVYDDLYFGLVFIHNTSLFPITVFIANSVSSYFVNVSIMSAAAVFAIIPPTLVFVLLQRYYIRGLLGGFMKA